MKYRKKPVVIDAIQLTMDNFPEVEKFLKDGNANYYPLTNQYGFLIGTLEGDHKAFCDDWIIKGVKGEFYPCKPDVFEMSYEKVN